LYGAIPTDPYSHTPGFAGVQQPGMTGQVKEDLITRLGEMGVGVDGGQLRFRRHLVSRGEFLTRGSTFHYYDVDGRERTLDLDPGSMAFTTCQTPVVAHQSGPPHIEITRGDGSTEIVEGLDLDSLISAAIFERTGAIRRLDVFYGFEGGQSTTRKEPGT
jgi:hypothetical protein